jgi:hypothetical protein
MMLPMTEGRVERRTEYRNSIGRHYVPGGLEEQVSHLMNNDLLPTPRVGGDEGYETRKARQGHAKAVSYLEANVEYRMANNGLLPTPTIMETNEGNLEKIDARRARAKETSTAGNGFGTTLGELANRRLLPTPQAMDIRTDTRKVEERSDAANRGGCSNLREWAGNGMLPTPMSTDIHHAERVKELKATGAETMGSRKNGSSRPNGITDYLDFHGMLPTPTTSTGGQNATAPTVTEGNSTGKKNGINLCGAVRSITPERVTPTTDSLVDRMMNGGLLATPTDQDFKNDMLPISQADRHDSIPQRIINAMDGDTQQMRLSPFFVEEMMGFPSGWTLAPFLTDASQVDMQGVPEWSNFPQTYPVIAAEDLNHLPWDKAKLRVSKNATPEQCATRYRKIAIKGYGNAIVPQCFLAIADAINAVESLKTKP